MANKATQKQSEDELNQLNLAMRQTPWYQEWFASKGLNPNQVQLNDKQRAELSQVANANGYQLGDRMKIDEAGNINQKGGFAGMPTWAKVAIVAGATAATGGALGAAGVGPMAGVMGGGGGTVTTTGITPLVTSPLLGGGTLAAGGGVGAATGTAAATAGGKLLANKLVNRATGSTMDRVGDLMRAGGGMIGDQLEASAQNRMENYRQAPQMAAVEARQMEDARRNLYRSSVAKNPTVSVENRRGVPTFSPEMLEGLSNLERHALTRTAEGPRYSTSQIQKASRPSTLERIGNWVGPGMTYGKLAMDLF